MSLNKKYLKENIKNLINKKIFLIFIFILVFSLSSVLGATLSSSESYKYKVYGNAGISSWSRPGYTIFIPTNTLTEWNAFKSAAIKLWNMQFCTATDGVWGSEVLTSTSSCNAAEPNCVAFCSDSTSGTLTKQYDRSCNSPSPSCGGSDCVGDHTRYVTESCSKSCTKICITSADLDWCTAGACMSCSHSCDSDADCPKYYSCFTRDSPCRRCFWSA